MIAKKIIYGNFLALLRNLTTTGADFEAYYNSKNEAEQEELLKLDEEVSKIVTAAKKIRAKGGIYDKFEDVKNLLEDYELKFNDYPNGRIAEIVLLSKLIEKLNQAIGGIPFDIQNVDINVSRFCLELLKDPISHRNFYYPGGPIENSVILIDLLNLPSLFEFITDTAFSVELACILLSKIGDPQRSLEAKQYVLVTNRLKNKPTAINALVCFHITSAGYHTHFPHLYDIKPNINPAWKILPGNHYQQFNDSLIILSEYNYHKDILDKYLRLYHLIENFMYKFPLVALERKHGGAVFSIRDFKRMYDKINISELTSLKKLLKITLDEEYSIGFTFNQFVLSKWTGLLPTIDETKINKLLGILGVTKTNDETFVHGDVNSDNLVNFYSQLIYYYRNSLVHNRETEFHLTHGTLLNHPSIGTTVKDVLELFLIPTLEEISFYLITEKNSIVWFTNSTLKLWSKAK